MYILLIIISVSICFYLLKSHYEYWEKRGVPGPKPKYIVGNLWESFILKKSPFEIFNDIYNRYQDLPIVGIYRTSTPSLIVRDPDLIKEFLVKSFDHFQENDLKTDKKTDVLIGRNPFFLAGEEWKIVRTQLTPAFTGGKMKAIYPLLEDMSQRLVQFIKNDEFYEAKELCMRFTLNNVASCAFGVEGNCFEEEKSEFKQIADNFLTPGTWSSAKIFFLNVFPVLADYVSVKLTPTSAEEKITNIVTKTLEYREKNKIVRNDYLTILTDLKKSSTTYEFTDLDVIAHAAGFIADGYETSSAVMSFMLYALANNSDAQSKLRQELVENFEKNDNNLPYDVLQGLPYLDAVTNESLRLYPPGFSIQKRCSKNYTYVSDNPKVAKNVIIEKGTPIIIPVYGLQHDPKYFEEPDKYKPERFLGTNKEQIRKYTFMPFGEGPRACLGQRFGLLQIKIGIAYIIKNFELTVNAKTKVPFKYDPMYFVIFPIGGLWVNFKSIS